MKLHLLRHAKTNQKSPTGKDFDRDLLPKGIKQTALMAVYLEKNLDFSKTDIYCSSSKRTSQTLDLLAKKLKIKAKEYSKELYLANHMELFSYLIQQKSKKDVLLIGHNNGISDLATYFTDELVSLQTCGFISLEFQTDSWQEISGGTACIIAAYRPEVDWLSSFLGLKS